MGVAEIAESRRKIDAEIAESKRKIDAEMVRQISLDLNKEISSNLTTTVPTKVLPVSLSKKSSSHLVAKKLSRNATKELFKPDLTTIAASKKQVKTTSPKEKQFKDSNN